jgi:hypothetical protein
VDRRLANRNLGTGLAVGGLALAVFGLSFLASVLF